MYQTFFKGVLYRTGAIPRTIPGCKLSNIQSATPEQWKKHAIEVKPYTPPEPTPEEQAAQTLAETKQAIQDMLDKKAREFEFESIHTAGIWQGKRNKATDLISWGAACWNKADEIRADVMAGKRPMPTVEEVLAELPEWGAV